MRKLVLLVLVAACGNMSAGNGGGGATGGTGGGGAGGTGGAAGGGGSAGSGGSGGGGTGGSGGGGAVAPPDYVSGTRIKIQTMTSADGAKAFLNYYDSQLSIACNFQRATDDTARCVPVYMPSVSSYFATAGCSANPLALAGAPVTGCAAPIYLSQSVVAATCSSVAGYPFTYQTEVWTIGSTLPAGTMIYEGTPASCFMTAVPTGYIAYEPGTVVPPSTFAQGSTNIEP